MAVRPPVAMAAVGGGQEGRVHPLAWPRPVEPSQMHAASYTFCRQSRVNHARRRLGIIAPPPAAALAVGARRAVEGHAGLAQPRVHGFDVGDQPRHLAAVT